MSDESDFTYDIDKMKIACSSDVKVKPENITKEQFLLWMKENLHKDHKDDFVLALNLDNVSAATALHIFKNIGEKDDK